jgi:hypothetical protein
MRQGDQEDDAMRSAASPYSRPKRKSAQSSYSRTGLRPRRQRRPDATPAMFKTIDLGDGDNAIYWVRRWRVTSIQLKIAVSRVGTDPRSVLQEILGNKISDSAFLP